MSGILYIVGTPIGNLEDLTYRAVRILGEVNFIAAEDTRVTRKLLSKLELHTPMVSYHEHNRRESGQAIAARLLAGESCALVTDAGMPGIADPGADLVTLCGESSISVQLVPGPSALTGALALSGFSDTRFCFEGFLSTAKSSRKEHLRQIVKESRTLVFYEAPHKLKNTLSDLLETLGDRRIVVARELTKLHEETLRLTLSQAVAHFAQNPPRGELVLVVAGAPPTTEPEVTLEQAIELANSYITEGFSVRDAARQAAAETSQPKRHIYEQLIIGR